MALFPRRQKIAVVELFGTIGGSIKSPAYDHVFSSIRKDPRIRAVVLDIDSPGGSMTASDYLYRSVAKVATEKPVLASVRGLCASGAYLIGSAAQRIVASPGSLVGSIGVISIRPVLEELFQRLGIGVSVNKSGALKDMGAFWRRATDEEDTKMQALVDESHEEFVSILSQARHMDKDTMHGLATGEVYRAPQALKMGLVDELGDLDRAIDLAAELSGAPRRPVHVRPRRSFRARLLAPLAESLVETTSEEIERRLWAARLGS
jgi:protease-4